jgi:putative hydrolase of the HAD superfamily
MTKSLTHIENWVFDLDNTLYPPECGLYEYMDLRIRKFVGRLLNLPDQEAHKVQKSYFRSHGTTLAGLMADHNTDPYEYLEDVHDFPLDRLATAPRNREKLAALPGRKIIFTNADAPYALRVLKQLDLEGIFDLVVDIHACGYQPKPAEKAYDTLFSLANIDPERSIFFEDMARNLAPAKTRGMSTVWINNGSELGDLSEDMAHIDEETHCLAHWLEDAIETRQFRPT